MNSEGKELRRCLFALKHIFQVRDAHMCAACLGTRTTMRSFVLAARFAGGTGFKVRRNRLLPYNIITTIIIIYYVP